MFKNELESPASLAEALKIVNEKTNIKPIAGGTDLLPLFHKVRHIEQLKAQPISISREFEKTCLVDLSNLKELRGIANFNNHIEIGSCTTHTEVASNLMIKQYYPSLAEAASKIGSPQIRNRGTIGGNIANASPSADTVPPLMVFQTEIELSSTNNKRKLFLEDFFVGPGETIIKPNEIISKIILPLTQPNTIQFYRRIAIRDVHACAKISIAFCAIKKDNIFENVRIASGAVAPTVISAKKTASLLEGKNLTPSLMEQAVKQVMEESKPIDDIRSTKEYRKAMIGELLRQELERFLNVK